MQKYVGKSIFSLSISFYHLSLIQFFLASCNKGISLLKVVPIGLLGIEEVESLFEPTNSVPLTVSSLFFIATCFNLIVIIIWIWKPPSINDILNAILRQRLFCRSQSLFIDSSSLKYKIMHKCLVRIKLVRLFDCYKALSGQ